MVLSISLQCVEAWYNSESAVPDSVGLELVTRKGKKVSDLVEDSAT